MLDMAEVVMCMVVLRSLHKAQWRCLSLTAMMYRYNPRMTTGAYNLVRYSLAYMLEQCFVSGD